MHENFINFTFLIGDLEGAFIYHRQDDAEFLGRNFLGRFPRQARLINQMIINFLIIM